MYIGLEMLVKKNSMSILVGMRWWGMRERELKESRMRYDRHELYRKYINEKNNLR